MTGPIRRGGQGGRAGKPGSARKGAAKGSGGQKSKGLAGRGPTPPASARTGHPASRRAAPEPRRGSEAAPPPPGGSARRPAGDPRRRDRGDSTEVVAGRNSVVEALRAHVPATALYTALGGDRDERVSEAIALASRRGIPLIEAAKPELDRLTGRAVHQGLALQVPPYDYLHPDDLLARAQESTREPLLVALDGVTDPRNLGAVVRSAAAFGAAGVLVPERRAAGMTAAAWKTSAGAVARAPVARATNLVRALRDYADAGLLIVGLSADGEVDLDDFEAAVDGLVLVVGSEGGGLSRLVAATCDLRVSIPMAERTESLNAGVAAGVALAEIARRRRL